MPVARRARASLGEGTQGIHASSPGDQPDREDITLVVQQTGASWGGEMKGFALQRGRPGRDQELAREEQR